jgi:hypothetical protein
MSSFSSNSKAKRSLGFQQGQRPSKKPRVGGGGAPAGPVIVYERPPRVVHAGPHEFMSVVQSLTGQQPSEPSLPEPEATTGARYNDGTSTSAAADDLVLITHGQQQQQLAPCADDRSSWASCVSGCCIVAPVPEQHHLLPGHDAGHTRAHQLSASLFESV